MKSNYIETESKLYMGRLCATKAKNVKDLQSNQKNQSQIEWNQITSKQNRTFTCAGSRVTKVKSLKHQKQFKRNQMKSNKINWHRNGMEIMHGQTMCYRSKNVNQKQNQSKEIQANWIKSNYIETESKLYVGRCFVTKVKTLNKQKTNQNK